MNDEKCLRFCRLSSASFAVKYEISLVSWVITRQKASLKPPASPFQSLLRRRHKDANFDKARARSYTHIWYQIMVLKVSFDGTEQDSVGKTKDAQKHTLQIAIYAMREKIMSSTFRHGSCTRVRWYVWGFVNKSIFLRMTWLKIIVTAKISPGWNWVECRKKERGRTKTREMMHMRCTGTRKIQSIKPPAICPTCMKFK